MRRYYVITSIGIICLIIFQCLYIRNLYDSYRNEQVVQIGKALDIAFAQEVEVRRYELGERHFKERIYTSKRITDMTREELDSLLRIEPIPADTIDLDKFVKEGIALGSGATAGVIIGAIIGALVHKKLPTSVWDKWLGGLCGGAAGLLAGGVAGPFRGGKNIDKAVAKLTDGAPQVQPEPAQPQAAPQIPQTTTPAGFNNLLKQAQQQKI